MALEITLRQAGTIPIEVEGITPDKCRALPLGEIERLPVFHGNRELAFAELFTVRGSADDRCHCWQGELSSVHWLGAKMQAGQLIVEGSAGRHLGSEMSGGEIEVRGSVSDWVGAEMRGGTLRVAGDAGHLVGAAYRGSPRGMRGGSIIVQGNAGDEVGHSLRRGTIAIGGACGDFVGYHMLAGTIAVLGPSGQRHGANMRRGSLIFLHEHAPRRLPTFQRACHFQPLAIQLVLQELGRLGLKLHREHYCRSLDLYNGDFLSGGRGEMFVVA
jgi:formylmethanofuran dehydrogenase subunit C